MLLPETISLHDKTKFDFHVIYFLPWKDQLVQRIIDEGGKVQCLNARNNLVILFKIIAVLRFVKKYKIDIIHCHLPWAGFVGRFVYRLTKIPVIYSEHNKQERYHWLTALVNKVTFNWQKQVVSVSEDVRESIIKNISPKVPVITILNGVNPYRFDRNLFKSSLVREDLAINEKAPIVGNVCVFRTQKRLDIWLEEAATIKKSIPKVQFLLIGDGPMDEMVRKTIDELGLTNHIHLPGRLDEVRPYLATMDIFMISSEFEGLPIALLEAMSMEVPVVTTDAGGIKEVIRHKHNGWVVGIDETHLLSDGVITLLKDKQMKDNLASNARSTVIKDFSLQLMVNELEETYESLILVE